MLMPYTIHYRANGTSATACYNLFTMCVALKVTTAIIRLIESHLGTMYGLNIERDSGNEGRGEQNLFTSD